MHFNFPLFDTGKLTVNIKYLVIGPIYQWFFAVVQVLLSLQEMGVSTSKWQNYHKKKTIVNSVREMFHNYIIIVNVA